MINPLQDHAFEKQVVGANDDEKSNFIKLSNGEEPVFDPNQDKFNLSNWILDKKTNIAMEEGGDGRGTSGRTNKQ